MSDFSALPVKLSVTRHRDDTVVVYVLLEGRKIGATVHFPAVGDAEHRRAVADLLVDRLARISKLVSLAARQIASRHPVPGSERPEP